MNDPVLVLSLIKAGFLGFSFLVLVFAWQTIKSFLASPSVQPGDMRIRAVYSYLGVSTFAIVAALVFAFFDPNRTVTVIVSKFPDRNDSPVFLRLKSDKFEFAEIPALSVGNDDHIIIEMDKMYGAIDDLKEEIGTLKGKIALSQYSIETYKRDTAVHGALRPDETKNNVVNAPVAAGNTIESSANRL